MTKDNLDERVKKFNEEFIGLLNKYNLGIGAQAEIRRDGTIGARPVLVDSIKKESPDEKVKDELAKPE